MLASSTRHGQGHFAACFWRQAQGTAGEDFAAAWRGLGARRLRDLGDRGGGAARLRRSATHQGASSRISRDAFSGEGWRRQVSRRTRRPSGGAPTVSRNPRQPWSRARARTACSATASLCAAHSRADDLDQWGGLCTSDASARTSTVLYNYHRVRPCAYGLCADHDDVEGTGRREGCYGRDDARRCHPLLAPVDSGHGVFHRFVALSARRW